MYYKGKNVCLEELFSRANISILSLVICLYTSFFNHSDDANCDAIQANYDKDKTQSEITRLSIPENDESNYCVVGEMKFIALRDILKGELTISYIQDEIQLQSRRQKLLSEYYFLCQCCKCITKEHGRKKKRKILRIAI
ncbi:26318_t:CDS:2 [Racocetra persica]|uniref:26318_t:CDS:1 n=1 Tax=Racocetra persica TaxID=160502 RepID=A0ACA9LME3_9GLOM|nr:26318_t:CDS:2 [Racocetra persica]